MPIYLLLILLIPFEVQQTLSKSIMGFTIIKWVGFLAVLAAFAYNAKSGRGAQIFSSTQGKLFGCLLFVVVLSWLSQGYWVITQPLQIFIAFTIFFFVTLSMVTSIDRTKAVFWTIVICMLLATFDVITDYLFFHRAYGISARPGGLFKDPNYYGVSAVIALPLVYYLAKTTMNKFFRFGFYATMFLYVVGIALSASRGAILGTGVMLVIALFLSKYKVRAFFVVTLLVVVGVVVAPENVVSRFSNTYVAEDEAVSGTAASTTRRFQLYKAGWLMILDHPLQGVGLGLFKSESINYVPQLVGPGVAHSTYIELGAELGLPGLFLFLGIIAFTYRGLLRLRKLYFYDDQLRLLYTSMLVALSGYVVSGAFLSAHNTKLFWLLVFLTIALERIAKEHKQQEYQEANGFDLDSLYGSDEGGDSSDESVGSGTLMLGSEALLTGSQQGYHGGQS